MLSLRAFPKMEVGDIIRLHPAMAEIRPRDGLTDFRVFREDDLVIFPLNAEERPRCLSNRFIFTKDDVELVKSLKAWSLERYRKPVERQQANTEVTDKNPITLSIIFKIGIVNAFSFLICIYFFFKIRKSSCERTLTCPVVL